MQIHRWRLKDIENIMCTYLICKQEKKIDECLISPWTQSWERVFTSKSAYKSQHECRRHKCCDVCTGGGGQVWSMDTMDRTKLIHPQWIDFDPSRVHTRQNMPLNINFTNYRTLKPGGKVVITDYCHGDKPQHSQHFVDYVKVIIVLFLGFLLIITWYVPPDPENLWLEEGTPLSW